MTVAVCPAYTPAAGLFTGLADGLDCRLAALGQAGYRALADPGSPVGLALEGILILCVALYGYRLLLGDSLSLRPAVITVARIGLVLALATQWPAYQSTVYAVVTEAPASLSRALGAPDREALTGRLQDLHTGLGGLAAPPAKGVPFQPDAEGPPVGASDDAGSRTGALAGAAFSTSALAALLGVRLVAALLLALAPLFLLFALFETTRGLFAGWVQTLAGATLAAIGVNSVLALEAGVVGAQLASVRRLMARDASLSPSALDAASGELLVVCLAFAIILLLVIVASFATTWRLGPSVAHHVQRVAVTLGSSPFGDRPPLGTSGVLPASAGPRTPARSVAEAVGASLRRETAAGLGSPGSPALLQTGTRLLAPEVTPPTGSSRRRLTSSAGATRRDRR